MKDFLNIQFLAKIYFIHFDIHLKYIFFPCGIEHEESCYEQNMSLFENKIARLVKIDSFRK